MKEDSWATINRYYEVNCENHGVITLEVKRVDAEQARREHLKINPQCRRRLGGYAP